jgi:hypothetical protein
LVTGDITSERTTCSPCQKANVSCRDGGKRRELQIRFSELTPCIATAAPVPQVAVSTSSNNSSSNKAPGSLVSNLLATPLNRDIEIGQLVPFVDGVTFLPSVDQDSPAPRRSCQRRSRQASNLDPTFVEANGSSNSPRSAHGPDDSEERNSISCEQRAHYRESLDQDVLTTQARGASPLSDSIHEALRSREEGTRLVHGTVIAPRQLTAAQAKLVKHFLTVLLPWVS